jgi:hypothetical protein
MHTGGITVSDISTKISQISNNTYMWLHIYIIYTYYVVRQYSV